jgi:hypothetical protein
MSELLYSSLVGLKRPSSGSNEQCPQETTWHKGKETEKETE